MPRASFFLCGPAHFGIDYEINPWMDVRRQADRSIALVQWQELRRVLEEEIGARVSTCRPRPGLPDMAFTANAGLVRGKTFIPSRFRYRERAGEEKYFRAWFLRHGYRIVELPADYRFEGAGDALFFGELLLAGYHYRTDIQTHLFVAQALKVRVLSLELVNPFFYHLDTCFMPLGSSSAIYYPKAFDPYSLKVLRANVEELIPVSAEEAYQFGCNAVVVGRQVVIQRSCRKLAREMGRRGYRVWPLEFSEFVKAGGAAKCLTLRLR